VRRIVRLPCQEVCRHCKALIPAGTRAVRLEPAPFVDHYHLACHAARFRIPSSEAAEGFSREKFGEGTGSAGARLLASSPEGDNWDSEERRAKSETPGASPFASRLSHPIEGDPITMATPKKGGAAVLEKPQSKTALTPEVPQAKLEKVGKSLDQQMNSEAALGSRLSALGPEKGETAGTQKVPSSSPAESGEPRAESCPTTGITLADVQGKMAEIDGHISALEERIQTFRQERSFHEQVVATYWPASV
jgi:hypothetical protein